MAKVSTRFGELEKRLKTSEALNERTISECRWNIYEATTRLFLEMSTIEQDLKKSISFHDKELMGKNKQMRVL